MSDYLDLLVQDILAEIVPPFLRDVRLTPEGFVTGMFRHDNGAVYEHTLLWEPLRFIRQAGNHPEDHAWKTREIRPNTGEWRPEVQHWRVATRSPRYSVVSGRPVRPA